ncbi:MAG: DUF3502 domain-containing protein [Clostridiales bacterium]|jgi:putative aldouronate transport system substrate-binding protein|nr:DUF3502 domain-containing protein [Clostridiales bacterium]
MLQKRILSLLTVACLAISLMACARSDTPTGGGQAAQSSEAVTQEQTAAVPEAVISEPAAAADPVANQERVDLVFYVMGDPPKDQKVVEDAINEKLLEKLNATVTFQFSTWTDFQQKYANELTSGNSDLIYIANWLNYGQLSAAGAFLELDDLLDQYAPELKDLAGESMLNQCRVDGELFAIPNLWPEYVPSGISYRVDLAEKYNLPRPDSLENAEAYFNGIKDNEPEQPLLRVTSEESQGVTVGFDAAHILNLKYPWVGVNGLAYGLTADYETPQDLYDYWASDDFAEDCKLLKRWSDMGFWSKSALSDTNDVDSYKNGLCIAIPAGQNPNKHITNMNDFALLHPDWKTEYITYGEITGAIYPGHATQNGTAVVRASKYPERAVQALNYFMTDKEMNRLVQAGIEGVHYEIADGVYHNLSSDSPQPFPYEGFNSWNLRVTKFKLLQETDVELNKLFQEYGVMAQKTKFPNVNIAQGFSENYDDYQAERAAVQNIIKQYLAPLQAGFVDDVDAAVEEFRSQVKAAGLEKCQENYSRQWLDYCDEYGYK